MTAEEIQQRYWHAKAAVLALWPHANVHGNGNHVVAEYVDDVSYDILAGLAEKLGTTKINVLLEVEPGYSEYTPGSEWLQLEIRW